jgi:hypothetical protein
MVVVDFMEAAAVTSVVVAVVVLTSVAVAVVAEATSPVAGDFAVVARDFILLDHDSAVALTPIIMEGGVSLSRATAISVLRFVNRGRLQDRIAPLTIRRLERLDTPGSIDG